MKNSYLAIIIDDSNYATVVVYPVFYQYNQGLVLLLVVCCFILFYLVYLIYRIIII